MKVVFRTDASIKIGTGHVMRCLTLADALAKKGAQCIFICREHSGNLIEHIRSKKYAVSILPMRQDVDTDLAHSGWLGATQEQDIAACIPTLTEMQPDWLVVDHYSLDTRWEVESGKVCKNLMVIDDLADRFHNCNLLLDQTFGRDTQDYEPLVPRNCRLLCGSIYALLRPEFSTLRPYSLRRREKSEIKNLLISMGGVDKDNLTAQVLNELKSYALVNKFKTIVVMGPAAPWLEDIRRTVEGLPFPTKIFTNVSNMAQLMADSDLAIGAAGATSWERCCLGLPSLLTKIADNQELIIANLCTVGAIKRFELGQKPTSHTRTLTNCIDSLNIADTLKNMTEASARVADGKGCDRVIEYMYG